MGTKQEFRFRHLDTIGAADAENDSFLSACFVRTATFDVAADCSDPRSILLGRVGSGKSALLREINRQDPRRAVFLQPEKLAMSHIANSEILRSAEALGADLSIFFKLLWRHVIAVELLSIRFDLDSESAVAQAFDRLKISQKSKKRVCAYNYLQEWGPSFWKESDYRIKELSQRFEKGIVAAVGTKVLKLGLSRKLEDEKRIEVRDRVQHVVNRLQVRELAEIIPLVNSVLDDPYKQYYVLIDRLDEGWVVDRLRFRLIRSLIETVRDFAEVDNAKVLIAMRQDLYRHVLAATTRKGFQREKHDALLLHLRWSRGELREVLDSRVRHLVERRYSSREVSLDDIVAGLFTEKKKQHPLEYLLDRSLMRPRDVIQYFNAVIKASDGQPRVLQRAVYSVEQEYSHGRVESLVEEWSATWPCFEVLLAALPRKKKVFTVDDINFDRVLMDVFTRLGIDEFSELPLTDPLGRAYSEHYHGHDTLRPPGSPPSEDERSAAIAMLYDAGICSVAIAKRGPYWSYDQPLIRIPKDELSNVKLGVHPTFWGHFDVH